MLRALAHHGLDGRSGDRRQLQVGEHAIERGAEVSQRIDHGAVQIHDGGVEVEGTKGGMGQQHDGAEKIGG
ncbi:hypothetical protein D3C80_2075490 [compost metagenome]